MDLTMTARAPGTVISTSRFHLGTRWGGQMMMMMRSKPAMCAAAAAMKVLPVPISPTTVVPRWALREQGRAPDGVGLRPQGLAEQPGQPAAVLRGPVERRIGLHHPLGDGVLERVDETSEVHLSRPPFRGS